MGLFGLMRPRAAPTDSSPDGRTGTAGRQRNSAVCILSTLSVCAPLLTACTVGPDYKRPGAPAPVAFKELQGWKISQPADAAEKGDWWSVYHDPELDRLERMVEVSNQTIRVSEADYRNAVALVAEARASLFPTIGLTPGVSRYGGGGGSGGSLRSSVNSGNSSYSGSGRSGTTYSISGTVAWVPDVWGSVRRQIESSVSGAQVSAADLANAELSAQAALATDYFDLRAEELAGATADRNGRRLPPRLADHGEPIPRRHDREHRLCNGPGAAAIDAGAVDRRRHPAGAIRARHRGADRPSAVRNHHPARASGRGGADPAARAAVGTA